MSKEEKGKVREKEKQIKREREERKKMIIRIVTRIRRRRK